MAFDGSYRMTDQELAEALAPLIAEADARIQAHPGVSSRTKLRAAYWHSVAEDIANSLIAGGQIQSFSGGDPKTPPTGP